MLWIHEEPDWPDFTWNTVALADKLAAVRHRQRLILGRMLDGFKGTMNTSKYAKITKCSPDTALRDITALMTDGLLIKNPGGGRSTSYRLLSTEELADSHGA